MELTQHEIEALAATAAGEEDLDAGCLVIQRYMGIQTGDVAGLWWAGQEWKWDDEHLRVPSLMDYIRNEMAWRDKYEDGRQVTQNG